MKGPDPGQHLLKGLALLVLTQIIRDFVEVFSFNCSRLRFEPLKSRGDGLEKPKDFLHSLSAAPFGQQPFGFCKRRLDEAVRLFGERCYALRHSDRHVWISRDKLWRQNLVACSVFSQHAIHAREIGQR